MTQATPNSDVHCYKFVVAVAVVVAVAAAVSVAAEGEVAVAAVVAAALVLGAETRPPRRHQGNRKKVPEAPGDMLPRIDTGFTFINQLSFQKKIISYLSRQKRYLGVGVIVG